MFLSHQILRIRHRFPPGSPVSWELQSPLVPSIFTQNTFATDLAAPA